MTIINPQRKVFTVQEDAIGFTKILIKHNTPTDPDIHSRVVWVDGVRQDFPYVGLDELILQGLSPQTTYDIHFALVDDFA